jgi:hypothetical protein
VPNKCSGEIREIARSFGPAAIARLWADATTSQASSAEPAKATAEQLVHHGVAGAVEEDAGTVADMGTCGNA